MYKSKANSQNAYQQYSVQDFDSYDCLKLSKRFYLALLFILRGYFVWLMSVTNMRDKVSFIQWIYPETSLFYLSLFSGAVGLFLLLIISLRRPGAYLWVRMSWQYSRVIIVLALLFDLLTHTLGYFYWQLSSIPWIIAQALITVMLIVICYSSERLNLNLNEFPQKLPEN
jgi:uncharacterized membrane protein